MCTKDPFFKSFLKSYFKSLALGLARQGVIAVTIHKWGGGREYGPGHKRDLQHDLAFDSSRYRWFKGVLTVNPV